MFKKSLIVMFAVMVASAAWALSDKQRADIEARIAPAGKVCMQGDNTCGGAGAAASSGPRSGEQVYNTYCTACHGAGVLGAPKTGTADWTARIDAKGLDTVYANGVNGIGAMPPKGTCADCSDDEIHAAIDFMRPQG
jgi:cytochrome c5